MRKFSRIYDDKELKNFYEKNKHKIHRRLQILFEDVLKGTNLNRERLTV